MKLLISLLLVLSSITANAITVKNCPTNLVISLQDFNSAQSLDPDYQYLERPEEIIASYQNMENMSDLKFNVELSKTASSKCYYSSIEENDNNYLRVIISGSLNKNAKQPAGISIFWSYDINNVSVNYSTFIHLIEVQTNKITMEHPGGYTFINHGTESCNWGECGPASVTMGKANYSSVEAAK